MSAIYGKNYIHYMFAFYHLPQVVLGLNMGTGATYCALQLASPISQQLLIFW